MTVVVWYLVLAAYVVGVGAYLLVLSVMRADDEKGDDVPYDLASVFFVLWPVVVLIFAGHRFIQIVMRIGPWWLRRRAMRTAIRSDAARVAALKAAERDERARAARLAEQSSLPTRDYREVERRAPR